MLRVVALAVTAIVLMPSGAHFFELPGKIGMADEAYFTVQSIYAGWSLFAVPIFAAIALDLLLAAAMWWSDRTGALLAAGAALLIVLSLAIFFVWILPGNQATQNWTSVPADWQDLRRNWEYGHAVNAVIVFVSFIMLAAAAVRRNP